MISYDKIWTHKCHDLPTCGNNKAELIKKGENKNGSKDWTQKVTRDIGAKASWLDMETKGSENQIKGLR